MYMLSFKAIDEKSRILILSRIGIQICDPVCGSEDTDPSQNVTDPEHCLNVAYGYIKYGFCELASSNPSLDEN
jgi:hypothetical protein